MKSVLLRIFYSIRTAWPIWYWLLNYQSRRSLNIHQIRTTDIEKDIITSLRNEGIATTSLDALFPGEHWLAKLLHYVEGHRPKVLVPGKKTFLLPFWDVNEPLNLENPFLELTLNPRVLHIVNSYMGMLTRLNYITLSVTVPVGNASAQQSQLWHRDPEEKRMVKMFIYLNDVDEESGPFIYIKESTYAHRLGTLFPQRPPLGSYPPAEAVERQTALSDRISCTGKAGTVIFCDTSGLHKGGHAHTRERVMFTSFFTAPTWSDAPRYSLVQSAAQLSALDDVCARYALTGDIKA